MVRRSDEPACLHAVLTWRGAHAWQRLVASRAWQRALCTTGLALVPRHGPTVHVASPVATLKRVGKKNSTSQSQRRMSFSRIAMAESIATAGFLLEGVDPTA